mmetsp:Transcript_23342/g.65966  ORF Transcript_23342/g.65966 Transcript_23342/m.65966 type:complete len:311 (-) Transcript_23342:102-1034(-)
MASTHPQPSLRNLVQALAFLVRSATCSLHMKRPAAASAGASRPLKRPATAIAPVVEEVNKRGRAAGLKAVRAAQKRGVDIINHGAGTMPVDAPAPHGGTRYNLLVDGPRDQPPRRIAVHDGKRDAEGRLAPFRDAPAEFRPSLTPAECLRKGIFGGCYFNPKGGKPGIFGREVAISHEEFPASWFQGVDPSLYMSRRYNVPTNMHGVKSGFGQKEWESKGWIHAQDPRGWFQWYCRFFCGRRSSDDARQIQRWVACASPKGRWRNQLCGAIAKGSGRFDDMSISPVIRQTLLHWAYELNKSDYAEWKRRQ